MSAQIIGYRELTASDKNLINEVKMLGERIEEHIDRLKEMPSVDQRWLAIGATDLQKGLMAMVRAIARPDSF